MSTQKNQTKKFVVLFATFIIPLLFFLFLASGKVNFEKLPILTENVGNIPQTSGVSLLDKISVVVFLGEDTTLGSVQQLLNLYQVVYKSTEKYNKFQVVVLVEENPQNIKKLTSELAFVGGVDLKKWHFVPVSSENTKTLFRGLKVPFELQENNSSSKAILIDETLNLRGRTDDEDTSNGLLFGYDMTSVHMLKNKLREDLKVVFYESKFVVKEPKTN
jgi:hypothetical protein